MMQSRRLIPVLLCLLLGACATHPPAPVVERSTQPPRAEIPVDGLYRVHSGDTLFGIAFKYGLDHRDLASWNNIRSPYIIYPDQVVRLRKPAGGSTTQTAGVPRPSSSTRTTTSTPAPTQAKPSSSSTTKTTQSSKPPPPPAKAPSQPPPKSTPAPAAGSSGWAWPASGNILRSFKAGDPTRNGIDIASREGSPVTASAAGEVVYSGNGLIGYGELVIIKHDERMLSAYAHNRVRLVSEGDKITRSQKIAEVGRNDRNESVLHFEIRRDGKPVDPQQYLPKR